MTGSPDVIVDVAILGGGIAGLWLLDRLRREGLSATLLETDRLGAGQSVASQGIIHGGTKYTLGLRLDSAVRELREMPATWRDSVRGAAGPDLSEARVLSPQTYLWVPRQLGASAVGAFSRTVMRSRMQRVQRCEWPDALDSPAAVGSVYTIDEIVLDIPSVLEALKAAHRDRIRRVPPGTQVDIVDGEGRVRAGDLTLHAQRVVLTAGVGNAELLARVGIRDVQQQCRPLQQIMIGGMKHPLYAHCVGKSPKPLATITAHPVSPGDYVWYVGGGIAEEGVTHGEAEVIQQAQRRLPRWFPAVDFGAARWATFRIDRAEAAAAGRRRPSGPVVVAREPFVVAWPTKLALAPALAERVFEMLQRQRVQPRPSQIDALAALPEPEVASPPWETVETWS